MNDLLANPDVVESMAVGDGEQIPRAVRNDKTVGVREWPAIPVLYVSLPGF